MSSEVFICNLALALVGKPDIISDLNEDSAEAKACKRFYAHSRDLLLEAYPWRFAGKTASLAQTANDRDVEWRFAYGWPSDCVKPRALDKKKSLIEGLRPDQLGIKDSDIPYGLPFESEGHLIYCDVSPAFLNYTRRITDPTKYGPLFIEALSASLATRIVLPLTRDLKLRRELIAEAGHQKGLAEMSDANQTRNDAHHASALVEGRE